MSFWLIEIMNRAYQHKGVTNDLQRERILKSKGIDFESRRFFVFDKEDKNCYECNSKIRSNRKIRQAAIFLSKMPKIIRKINDLSGGVSKAFSGEVLYENATFQINPGEKIGLVGKNGAGKTTFFE